MVWPCEIRVVPTKLLSALLCWPCSHGCAIASVTATHVYGVIDCTTHMGINANQISGLSPPVVWLVDQGACVAILQARFDDGATAGSPAMHTAGGARLDFDEQASLHMQHLIELPLWCHAYIRV